jgi:FkbM family methyltransferase
VTADIHQANGARFIAADDMIVAWERRERRPFEPETTAFLRHRWRRGALFVDAGASTGWFAIPAALAGATVWAFEPFVAARRRLFDNAVLNGVDFAFSSEALSDRSGASTFWRNPRVRLTSGGSIARPGCRQPVKETVATTTLDGALRGMRAAVVKIDVEGHEAAVLEGARQSLAHRPPLVLEANDAACVERLDAWLAEFGGYAWRMADGRNMLCSPT